MHDAHDPPATRLRPAELIALLAASMSLTALGIDVMLPAFGAIRLEYGLAADSNATAGLVTTYFLGLAVGQLVYGILSDAVGRKRALYLGYGIYLAGALAAIVAPSLPMLYVARALWGFGAAAGRTVTLAVVRDVARGDRMSRMMSFVMAVFITVPIVAPTIGASIIAVAAWRWTFGLCVVAVVLLAVWATRLPETLAPADRLPLTATRIVAAARVVAASRPTRSGAVGQALLYGVLTSWVASSELIIGDVFGRGDQFPLVFGALAAMLGLGTLANARLVRHFGTRAVTSAALRLYLVAAVVLVLVTMLDGGVPPFWLFVAPLGLALGCHAVLIPNVNSLAMDPVGHVAGTASSLVGAIQVAGGALIGSVLDRAFDGTVRPFAVGVLVLSGLAAVAMRGALAPAVDDRPDDQLSEDPALVTSP